MSHHVKLVTRTVSTVAAAAALTRAAALFYPYSMCLYLSGSTELYKNPIARARAHTHTGARTRTIKRGESFRVITTVIYDSKAKKIR